MHPPLRLAAVAVLLLQLQPFALPALCGPDRGASASCEQPMAPGPAGAAVGANGDAQPCASAALCGAPPTAIADPLAFGLAVSDVERGVFFSFSPLQPGDSPAPIPPPPQA